MSSVISSQSVILAAAMAASGAVIFLSVCRPHKPQLMDDQSQKKPPPLRSCLSSGNSGDTNKKNKKKVRFADDVVKSVDSRPSIRRSRHQNRETTTKKKRMPCRQQSLEVHNKDIPENRAALYHGILRDRVHVHRTQYSY